MKIAIAEEDDAIRRLLHVGEAVGGDQLVALGDPDDLLRALDDPDLRVLIFDSTAPRLAGLDLCRRIKRRSPSEPYIYLIAVVGSDTCSERLAAFEAGADAVVARPCDLQEVRARVAVARRIATHEDWLRGRSNELEQIRLDLEARNATLAEIASSDALTGLRNRRFFQEALDSQFSLARRKGLPMSLVMIDVDQFKAFNDQFGHPAGDDVLREVGALLRSCVRDHDIVARYGGEEFAILLPATQEGESLPLADRLCLTVAHHRWPLRPVTISLGVATLRPDGMQPTDLIDQADRALYYSKALGRNRATHSHHLPDLPAHQDLALPLTDLPRATRTPCEATAG